MRASENEEENPIKQSKRKAVERLNTMLDRSMLMKATRNSKAVQSETPTPSKNKTPECLLACLLAG